MGIDISVDAIANKVFDNFKKMTPGLIAVIVFSGLILFLPESILEKMSLNVLPDVAKRIIGIIFLVSCSFALTIIFFCVIKSLITHIKHILFRKKQMKKYKNLNDDHKQIIKRMMHNPDKTIYLDMHSGDTIYLQNNKFIYMPDNQFLNMNTNGDLVLKYAPEPWLIDLYNKKAELFK